MVRDLRTQSEKVQAMFLLISCFLVFWFFGFLVFVFCLVFVWLFFYFNSTLAVYFPHLKSTAYLICYLNSKNFISFFQI